MSKLTAAIIEDEVPAARLLSSIITRLREWRSSSPRRDSRW